MKHLPGLMIQGTCSDAGKSFIVTGLCRLFSDMGYRVAPFKSQNMSNNSYVTPDCKEIGRAQGAQAEAARAIPSVYMNPILLKPMMDTRSEVVLLGEVFRPMDGWEYHRGFTMEKGLQVITTALDHLATQYDTLVIEGAGSPAEVNLNDREIVNMRVARLARVPVILIADIDRGGSFASLVGTLELVGEYRRYIKGVIFNKFRGDISLLQDGLDWFEEYTGIPVIGVMPYLDDVLIETEDAQSPQRLAKRSGLELLDIAVIALRRVSNNTDVEPFIHELDVNVRIVRNAGEFGNPDAVIIPGTKSTLGDLEYLRTSGLDNALADYAGGGGIIFGICGGYQILGKSIDDPFGVDGSSDRSSLGLGLLPIATTFEQDKSVKQGTGRTVGSPFGGISVKGYEIHLGCTVVVPNAAEKPFIDLGSHSDGYVLGDGQIIGTYVHGIFDNDSFRSAWLNRVRERASFPIRAPVNTSAVKEKSFDRLAQACRDNLDIEKLLELMVVPVD
ncbi:MAG TPA: cobyric acid synthase [Capsulimonadaceae bacterium]|jgi:adenosylcobyric acid synthase